MNTNVFYFRFSVLFASASLLSFFHYIRVRKRERFYLSCFLLLSAVVTSSLFSEWFSFPFFGKWRNRVFWFCANMILQCNVRILAINNQLFYVFHREASAPDTQVHIQTLAHFNNSYFFLLLHHILSFYRYTFLLPLSILFVRPISLTILK